jgi:hypothetical protein
MPDRPAPNSGLIREETALAVVSAAGSLVGLQTLLLDERTPPVDLEALAVSPLAGTCSRQLQSLRQMSAWLEPFRHSLTWPEGCGPRVWDGGLSLWFGQFGDAVLLRLADLPQLAQLRYLDVGGNNLTPAGLRAFLASPFLSGLRMLRLSFNDALGDPGAELVAACPALSGLLSLKMSFCKVGDAGVRATVR